MQLAVKLGNSKELELLKNYRGGIRFFELPAELLTEKHLVRELLDRGFSFNVHGAAMYHENNADKFIKQSFYSLDLCKELGCNNFILHGLVGKSGIISSKNGNLHDKTFRALQRISEYAVDLEISCFLENGCYVNSALKKFYEYPSDSLSHLYLAESLNMRIVLDIGHAALSARWFGKDLEEFLSPYLESLKIISIIHISDNSLLDDDHTAVGEGQSDIHMIRKVIEFWPDAIMTVENYPQDIYKSLVWLVARSKNEYKKTDIEDLCRAMKWDFNKNCIEYDKQH
jgi:sugar phosphate isomerase/epimerase